MLSIKIKNIFLKTTVAALLFAAVSSGAYTAPLLRIGVISDSQSNKSETACGYINTKKAFDILAGKNIDVLIMAGDLSNGGQPEAFVLYGKLFRESFAKQKTLPVQVAIPGNHDYWNKEVKSVDEKFANFAKGIGEESVQFVHKTVEGYDFIGIASETADGEGVYTEKSKDFF